ncbi:MAG: hypothetical protein UR80_C0003G0012 [Parcubacteria group bacterium GW2011_GWB1_35_5]|nr:MAG: hypothetical protein UR50_C0003G0060 [Parcubacteria group bacterium GW2011_GWC1_34_10]KKP81372.1 MAG: hypothetical protein UR80_C0003G0012 [Parcubacteria group bacterium GW2011_GWB1_35_5]
MIASLIALPNLSLAESNYSDTEAAREASEYNAEQKRETIKDEIEAKKEALEQEMEQNREEIKNRVEERKEGLKNKIEERREELKQNLEQKREEIKNRVEERRQNTTDQITERVNKFISKIIERFSTAANRLDILVIRIESRIEKIEARDIDVTEANDLLVIAKTKIETAKTSISLIALPEIIDPAASTTASAIKEAFETTKTQIEQAKKDLKAAHAALVEVIKSLKPGDNKLREIENDESEDDSTATTTDDN